MTKNDSTNHSFFNGNDFYICDEIDEPLYKSIIQPLRDKINEEAKKKDKLTINLFISSVGGYVYIAFDIIALIEQAKKLGVTIHTYVTSMACSCGSLIAVTGHKRFVSNRAYHMIHYPRGRDYSHNPEHTENNAQSMMFLHEQCEAVYKKYTKDKTVGRKMLTDGKCILGGEQLIKLGYADELI